MRDVLAWVVGIDRYDEVGFTTGGPCNNALAIIGWLRSRGVPPERVHAFLAPAEGDAARLLAPYGVEPAGPPTREALHDFWGRRLPSRITRDTKLLVFLSGHGCVAAGRRLLICADYLTGSCSNVLNVSDLVQHLRTADFPNTQDQLVLADICANRSEYPVAPSQREWLPALDGKSQLAYFASAEGRTAAIGEDGMGAFTSALLDAVEELEAWPEQDDLVRRVQAAAARRDARPFRYAFRKNDEVEEERVVSSRLDASARRAAEEAGRMLANVPEANLRVHYLRTLGNVTLPTRPMLAASTREGMCHELSLLDRETQRPTLAQFVLRVNRIETLPAFWEWWEAKRLLPGYADAAREIDEEPDEVLLLFELEGDEGAIRATLRVRKLNMRPWPELMSSLPVLPDDPTDWEGLRSRVGTAIEEMANLNPDKTLHVHFLIDPPLFGHPLHDIVLASDGRTLGEVHVCVAHYRSRFLGLARTNPPRWRAQCNRLAGLDCGEIRLVEVEPGCAIPKEEGIVHLARPLGRSGADVERRFLSNLLELGPPYLCWPHGTGPWGAGAVGEGIRGLLRASSPGALQAVPDALLSARKRGEDLPRALSVIWDEPHFKRSDDMMMRGVSR